MKITKEMIIQRMTAPIVDQIYNEIRLKLLHDIAISVDAYLYGEPVFKHGSSEIESRGLTNLEDRRYLESTLKAYSDFMGTEFEVETLDQEVPNNKV